MSADEWSESLQAGLTLRVPAQETPDSSEKVKTMGVPQVVSVTLKFGVSNSRQYSVPAGTTYRQIIEDPANQQLLGYPSNVRARESGVVQDLDTAASNGDEISLESVGTTKAS